MSEFDLSCRHTCPHVDVGSPHPCGSQTGQGNEVCEINLKSAFPGGRMRVHPGTNKIEVFDDDERPIAVIDDGTVFKD